MIKWRRAFGTEASERFIAERNGREAASVDLHYLADGTVRGTVVLLTGIEGDDQHRIDWSDEQIPDLLASLDQDLLPTVDQADGDLILSVVVGKVVGACELDPPVSG